jgi:hypothetical protein
MGFEGFEVTCLSGVGSSVRSVPSSCWSRGDITEGSAVTDSGEAITTGVIGVIGILSATVSDEWILAVLGVL